MINNMPMAYAIDYNGHGTEMCNLIAQTAIKSTLIVIKAVEDNGSVKGKNIATAINYAIKNNATVIN